MIGASYPSRLGLLPAPIMLAVMYLVLIVVGSVLLSLPIAQSEAVSFGQAIFTATSAVTVTGLNVVDTGAAFSLFGEAVILFLMQLGGLGLMTFAALLLVSLGISVGIPSRIILREELGQSSFGALSQLARLVLVVALLAEGVGALCLAVAFVPNDGLAHGLWSAVFHAVSAFNNAGFSLYPDSLMDYAGNPIVALVIPALFMLGGIGFIVMGDVWQKRQWRTLTLHSKVMLTGTLVLTVAAWLVFATLEWSNPGTLGGLDSLWDKLLASFFQAATPRTAGFNTVETSAMTDASAIMTIALMFIGGGPTSTAGGVKVTTAVILILATIAFFKRREELNLFGRSLGLKAVLEVMALTTISAFVIFASLFLLAINHDGDFLAIFFEAVSAFGTVGLSLGYTPSLDGGGQAVVMLLMFLGRVGPLTLGFVLATRTGQRVRYPKGQVYLG